MKKILCLVMLAGFVMPAFAATSSAPARRSVASQMVMAAPRATASTNQITAMANANNASSAKLATTPDIVPSAVRVDADPSVDDDTVTDNREKEKLACISNNIGIGNTFVWASRYSNTNDYAAMVEDVENPENNVCFVLVEVKSNDPKISVSDVPGKYFVMGNDITCGDWADVDTLRQRILNAKKSVRTWATVGGVVGGAGIGVGAMELFGNRWIGGAVEGQAAMDDGQLLLSQLLVMRDSGDPEYDDFVENLTVLQQECNSDVWMAGGKPAECDEFDYEFILNGLKQIE